MADTIVTNSPGSNDGSSGWAVALIVLIVVIVGGFVMYQKGMIGTPSSAGTTNINVVVPNPITPAPVTP